MTALLIGFEYQMSSWDQEGCCGWYKAMESVQDPVSSLGTLYFFLEKRLVRVKVYDYGCVWIGIHGPL